MKSNKLTIEINKPIHEIFLFTIDPKNTPSWISSIVKEEVNERPTKIGTIYKNQNQNGKWSEYIVTAYDENRSFVLASNDKNYNVKYSFQSVDDNATEFEYYEWVNQGDLEGPFTIETLNKLKLVLEGSN